MAHGKALAEADMEARAGAPRARGRRRTDAGRPAYAGLPVLLVALALSGCGAGEGLDGSFGSADVGVATPAGGTSAGVVNSVTTGALTVGSGADLQTYDCPVVTVRTGAATWQLTDKPSGALRLQGNIGRLARECSIAGGTMQVKVGLEGRLLLGEKGAPGQVKVPIRIAVVQEGPSPKTVAGKFFLVPVEIPRDQAQATFTVVEDQISFPLLKPAEMERYVIYVGFDPQGSETKERPKPSSSSSAKPRKPPAASSGSADGEVFGPPPR